MPTKRTEVLLGRGNYFHWEYNMRMTLARKGLLAHVQIVKPENEITEMWLTNDTKALGIIAQGVELQHQTKIRMTTRAMKAWNTLRELYNRTSLHNRFTMTRRLHDFKMESGSTMAAHLYAFDELVVGLQTMREPIIIAAKTSAEIREVKNALKAAFKMKELSEAKFILGMEIDHDLRAGTLMIKRTRYIDDVAKRFSQENAKFVDNP